MKNQTDGSVNFIESITKRCVPGVGHRIVLTERCNMNCPHCFNANDRLKGVMDADILLRYMRENARYLQHYSLKIMGGEPTLHPRFAEVVDEACKYFGLISIFTNGTKPELLNRWFPQKVWITVNGHTYKPGTLHSNMTLHFVITDEDFSKIFESIERVPNAYIVISPNTQVNLFDQKELEKYRKIWIKALTTILPGQPKDKFTLDHCLPICFYTEEMLEVLHTSGMSHVWQTDSVICCSEGILGLIDYNFDFYFCNQTRIKLGSILREDGSPKSTPEIADMVVGAAKLKIDGIKKLNKKCKVCKALPMCKVGCYYNILEMNKDG